MTNPTLKLVTDFNSSPDFKPNFKSMLNSLTKHLNLIFKDASTKNDKIRVKCQYSDETYDLVKPLSQQVFSVADGDIIREFKLIARKADVDTQFNGTYDSAGEPIEVSTTFSHLHIQEFKPSTPKSTDDICDLV